MRIEEIANQTNFADETSVKNALQKMESVSNYEIHLFLTMRDTLNATSSNTRHRITLAQAEMARREAARMEKLTTKTTITSALLAGLGVIAGAIIGAVATALLTANLAAVDCVPNQTDAKTLISMHGESSN